MFDDSLSKEINPEDLQLYLAGSDWHETIASDYLSLWQHAGVERDLFVPRTTSAVDFDRQVSLILRFLAGFEGRQPREIATDVKFTGADVIRVGLDTAPFERGSIRLEKATEVIVESKHMLMAAARSAVKPQSYFSSRPPTEVSEYLASTRLAQTEVGSFIFTIVSPIVIKRATLEQEPRKPFARRVTETLSRSVLAIREAATPSARPLTAVFEDLVEEGVSANLCDALSTIAKQSIDFAVDLKFKWSSKAQLGASQPITHVVLPPSITPALPDMAKHLKEVSPQPGYEVIGSVERLSNQEPGSPEFDLYLRVTIEGHERKIALELSDEDRAVASEAWATGRSVYTKGTLDRRWRPYKLLEPEVFEIVNSSGS